MTGDEEKAVESWKLIQALLTEETSMVTILSPNPDFNGPGYMIFVNGDWTEYNDVSFAGDSYLACLHNAYSAYKDSKTK